MSTLSTPATTPPAFSTADVERALDQLNRSERGRRAAVQLRRFLDANDGSALSLDADNWRALETLTKACRVFGGYAIRNVLPKR